VKPNKQILSGVTIGVGRATGGERQHKKAALAFAVSVKCTVYIKEKQAGSLWSNIGNIQTFPASKMSLVEIGYKY
jgi:hypothetical protein